VRVLISDEQTKEPDENVGSAVDNLRLKFQPEGRLGVSQKAHPVVIARRNDEAIQLLPAFSGLLHFVRNDEIGLSRHPQYVGRNNRIVVLFVPQV
jgi:hypothetical protein